MSFNYFRYCSLVGRQSVPTNRVGIYDLASVIAVPALTPFEQLAYTAPLWLSATSLSQLADDTQITSWINQGSAASTYDASVASLGPKKVTYNGFTALQFDSTTFKKINLATEIDLVSGSLFMVGYQTSSRMIALGGSLDTSSGNCFYGYSGSNGTLFLLRNTSDGGFTSGTLSSVAGLKAFGMIKNSTTSLVYYDNSTTVTSTSAISGTFRFKKIGTRDYSNSLDSQPSTGYLTEVIYFDSVLSDTNAQLIMSGLKSRYSIA